MVKKKQNPFRKVKTPQKFHLLSVSTILLKKTPKKLVTLGSGPQGFEGLLKLKIFSFIFFPRNNNFSMILALSSKFEDKSSSCILVQVGYLSVQVYHGLLICYLLPTQVYCTKTIQRGQTDSRFNPLHLFTVTQPLVQVGATLEPQWLFFKNIYSFIMGIFQYSNFVTA